MLPTFLGIGAPKAGTTFIYNRLRRHPEVFVSSMKEPCYFDFRYGYRSLAWYKTHFEEGEGHTAVGEFSTRYLASEEAPRRVMELLPDARLVVSLRNPMDQVYSHYWHLQRQNFHQPDLERVPDTFEEALERFPDKLLEPARYAHHLQRWLTHFERDQIHLLFFQELKQDPEAVFQALYTFLGVDPSVEANQHEEPGSSDRRGTSPRHPMLQTVHAVTYKYLNHWIYAPLKTVIGVESASKLKETLQVRHMLERLFRREGYPDMSSETRDRLNDYFADDVARLEELTDRDLSHWT